MVIKQLSYAIVLVGKWNPSILTPSWLVANIVEDNPQVLVEFSINLDMPSRYRVKNVIIAPALDKTVFLSMDNSDESLTLMESMAIKLCSILSHTPLAAVGINFGFIEKTNKDELLQLIKFADTDKITENGWQISKQSIKRALKKDNYFINLTISFNDQSDFEFNFNFHYPVNTSAQVSTCLQGKVIEYKNQALTLLDTLFNLKLETND